MRKISITPEESKLLKEVIQTSKNSTFRQRAECILLASNLGLISVQLAKHFSVTCKTIYHWFNLWDKGKLEALIPKKGRGCKQKLAGISKEELKELLEANSQNIKEVLCILRSKYAIDVSKKTLIRFFKR